MLITKKEALQSIDELVHEASINLLRLDHAIKRINDENSYQLFAEDEKKHLMFANISLNSLLNLIEKRLKNG